MRFLRLFGMSVLAGVFILAFLYVAWVEVSSVVATRALREDFRTLGRYAFTAAAADACQPELTAEEEKLISEDDSEDLDRILDKDPGIEGYRLRFLNDTDYVLEAVCKSSQIAPIELGQRSLRWGLTKIRGSGVFYPLGHEEKVEARVLVQQGYRVMEVGYTKGELVSFRSDPSQFRWEGMSAAETVCEGWGNHCCLPPTMVGSGEQETRVLDCPEVCYPACLERPVVVYFNTQPVMDLNKRVIEAYGTQLEVRFGYQVEDFDGAIVRVSLDTGDGELLEGEVQDMLVHTYRCDTGVCEFEARLRVVDSDKLTLSESPLNTVRVRLQTGS